MPKKAKELSAIAVKKLRIPGFYAVGGVPGLHLQIKNENAKSWILRSTVGIRRRDIGLGGYDDVSLKKAREIARELRQTIKAGKDPIAEKKAAREALVDQATKEMTFDEASKQYLDVKLSEFKNPKHRQQWQNTLKTYASPSIGKIQITDIDTPHILSVLQPIWQSKTETAKRVQGRIEKVIDWSITSGYREGNNPARWKNHLQTILPTPNKIKKVQGHAALPWPKVGYFMGQLRQREGMAARALEFAILCASRSGEVRGATWDEIDIEGKVWTIPADRMKMRKEHRVPLSTDAIKLLKALPRLEEVVFSAPRGGQLSDATLGAVIKRMHAAEERTGNAGFIDPKQDNKVITAHGFRSTFRDWCEESTSYPHAVTEMALAHTIGSGVEKAYRRGDLLEKRTRLMADWAKFCGAVQPKGEVVSIRSQA